MFERDLKGKQATKQKQVGKHYGQMEGTGMKTHTVFEKQHLFHCVKKVR